MERCGFFDANLVGEEYDRVYLASQFAAYFASFIGNGVFGGKSDELQVLTAPNPSMQVTISSGQGWINGYWYENTDDLLMPIELADGVLNRIDSIVLRLGFSERNMWLAVKKGTLSTNPSPPELTRSADYYELQLATIRVRAGAINITQSDITDTRLNSSVCGLVMGLVQQLDTTTFGKQLEGFITQYMLDANAEFNEYVKSMSDSYEEYKKQLDDRYALYVASLNDLYALAKLAYDKYLEYLNDLKTQGQGAYEDYLVWLGNLKNSSAAEIELLLEQLKDLISEDVASALSLRITELENQVPTEQVAEMTHGLGSYVHCDTYEFEYGAGVQTAGEGPAGGGALTSTPCEYTMNDQNHILVKTKTGYGVVEAVNKVNDRMYVVVFEEKLMSILIILRN